MIANIQKSADESWW